MEQKLEPEGTIIVKRPVPIPTPHGQPYLLMAPQHLFPVPPAGVQVFRHMSLWGTFHRQTILLGVLDYIQTSQEGEFNMQKRGPGASGKNLPLTVSEAFDCSPKSCYLQDTT